MQLLLLALLLNAEQIETPQLHQSMYWWRALVFQILGQNDRRLVGPGPKRKAGLSLNLRYGVQNQRVARVNAYLGPRAQRSALQRERDAFCAVTGRQIDAFWGWSGNSAAKVVHFRCFLGLLRACRKAILWKWLDACTVTTPGDGRHKHLSPQATYCVLPLVLDGLTVKLSSPEKACVVE